jgi:hypothetical protein
MARSDWRPVGRVGLPELREARAQAHHAAQWLSRAAYGFLPAQADYSHTNLGWEEAFDGFATHALKDGVRLGVRLTDLSLALLDTRGTLRAQFRLDRRTDADVRAWLGPQISALGLEAARLDTRPDYQMPEHPIAKGAAYAARGDALSELAAWFANADRLLQEVRRSCAAEASPVRCWPHHFDIATLIALPDEGTKAGRSVNAGLSPGDHYYDEPYYYVSPWPYPDADKLPPVPEPGRWHTHEFTAAVAPASRILRAKNPQADTEQFLRAAVTTVMQALG